MNVLILTSSTPDRIEWKVMRNIWESFVARGLQVSMIECNRSRSILETLIELYRCDVAIVHSPLVMSLPFIKLLELLGKPILSIVWDRYPVSISGVRYDTSSKRIILDYLENILTSKSNITIVPSRDFLQDEQFSDAVFIGIWPKIKSGDAAPSSDSAVIPAPSGKALQVIFGGQINATRGLPAAVRRLDDLTDGAFHLRIASPNPLPVELSGLQNVEHLGLLDPNSLKKVAEKADCGLVALEETFDGPGFPSKTFEYLNAGIPCIYHGKFLKHYIDALEGSGAGVDITNSSLTSLNKDNLTVLKTQISRNRVAFMREFELDAAALEQCARAVTAR